MSQDGVLSRRQLYGMGVTRWEIKAEVRAGRWQLQGRQSVAVTTGELSQRALWFVAIFEVGSGAALDGVTALQAAGLAGFAEPIHVSIPKSGRPRRPRGIIVHETRRRQNGDVVDVGVPRVRPERAALRGALWARSNRQAALILLMAVGQRLTTGEALLEAFEAIRRHRRRLFLAALLLDIRDGVRAMGELDFARMCRQRGLPEPSRQVVRQGRNGHVYLDVYWDQWGVVAEVDGVHHLGPALTVADALRQNDLTLAADRVIRIPVLGLRLQPTPFLDQVEAALRAGGCPLSRSSAA